MYIAELIIRYKYLAIFFAVMLEGPIAMTASGFLYRLGYLELFLAYFLLLLGDLVSDILWYSLGYYAAPGVISKYGKYISISPEAVDRVKILFRRHESKILIISKVTMGLGFALATQIAAGMSKVPLKKFIWFNFIGGLVWTAFLMSLGYLFGNIYVIIGQGLHQGFVVVAIIVLVILLFGFGKFMRDKLMKNNL